MPGPHDPNHTSSTGLALRDEGEETAHPTSTKEERRVKDSPPKTRFWFAIVALVLGLATLALGFIFYPTWPGALAAEVIGAGLALLAVCGLLIAGAWHGASKTQIDQAEAPETLPAQPAEPSSTAVLSSPDLPVEAPPQTAPAITTLEPPAEPTLAPANEPALEAAVPEISQAEDSALSAPPEAPASEAPAETSARMRKRAQPQPGQKAPNEQNGQTPTAGLPRARARRGEDAALPLPPFPRLQRSLLPSIGSEIDAEEISQLLGDIAEQTVMAFATRGKRGLERRTRMAAKIDAFRQEMSVDVNYKEVVAYLDAIIALLRAGQIIPASPALVDPFDEFYNYVLTLIR